MAVKTHELRTTRGDHVAITLFTHAGEAPTILVTVLDADGCAVPTAEFTIREAAEFRDLLRELSVDAAKGLPL